MILRFLAIASHIPIYDIISQPLPNLWRYLCCYYWHNLPASNGIKGGHLGRILHFLFITTSNTITEPSPTPSPNQTPEFCFFFKHKYYAYTIYIHLLLFWISAIVKILIIHIFCLLFSADCISYSLRGTLASVILRELELRMHTLNYLENRDWVIMINNLYEIRIAIWTTVYIRDYSYVQRFLVLEELKSSK